MFEVLKTIEVNEGEVEIGRRSRHGCVGGSHPGGVVVANLRGSDAWLTMSMRPD
jgi:hypothetical protein